jgi:hypothetical protein
MINHRGLVTVPRVRQQNSPCCFNWIGLWQWYMTHLYNFWRWGEGSLYIVSFSMKQTCRRRLCFDLQARKAHNLTDPLDGAVLSHYTQWLRTAVSKGSARLGAFLARRRQQNRLPKRRASLKIRRWRDSRKTEDYVSGSMCYLRWTKLAKDSVFLDEGSVFPWSIFIQLPSEGG